MDTIYFKNIRKLKENQKIIENRLKIKLIIHGKQVTLEGQPINEYEAQQILEAFDFGFELKDALQLTNENFIFRKLNIKDFTRRKDLNEVRGRIIGKEGKTKRTIENISDVAVVVHEKEIGIIGYADSIEEATQGITNLIRGSKQGNVYGFLERMNTARKDKIDLGLKNKKQENNELED